MPCLFALLALLTPRLVIILLWLFTNWFRGVFDTAIWPVLGFFLAPTTLLWYSAVQHWFGGQWGFWAVVGLIIALAIDISPAKGRRRERVA
jgi:hypothetical protein